MTDHPTKDEIRIGRLLKKIEKLKQQRDFFQKQCKYYEQMILLVPSLPSKYQLHNKLTEERMATKHAEVLLAESEQRVTEQSALIERLLKEEKNT